MVEGRSKLVDHLNAIQAHEFPELSLEQERRQPLDRLLHVCS
ncbi:hypothetical protein SynA1825c_01279 [Synechococcus sp. A18-25c]|nr:hypothetical protein SynA1560_01291 [Synechococcus sp. A15-60]QNJ19586.1 hypothetical protein SynA1825c_01279 [Synechococcus sp. A18-25c]